MPTQILTPPNQSPPNPTSNPIVETFYVQNGSTTTAGAFTLAYEGGQILPQSIPPATIAAGATQPFGVPPGSSVTVTNTGTVDLRVVSGDDVPGSICVLFNGICTILSATSPAGKSLQFPLPEPYRVVLLNWTDPGPDNMPFGVSIPAHSPMIITPTSSSTAIGWMLSVSNVASPAPPPIFYNEPIVPNLTGLMANVQPISAPSADVWTGASAGTSAVYFDISSGTIVALTNYLNAVFLVVAVLTDGGPTLSTTPMTSAQPITPPIATPLPTNAIINISNQGSSLGDPFENPNADFLLHYLTAETLPTVPQVAAIPLPLVIPAAVPPISVFVAGGCSNSNYP